MPISMELAQFWWCSEQISFHKKDLITASPNHCRFHWYGYQSNCFLDSQVIGPVWRPPGLIIDVQCLAGAITISGQYFNGFAELNHSGVCGVHVTTSYLICPLNLKATQLELCLIMARKGKPLANDTFFFLFFFELCNSCCPHHQRIGSTSKHGPHPEDATVL